MKQILMLLCCLSAVSTFGQCDKCQKVEEKIDFCYTDSLFANQCLQFIENKDYFYLNGKKSARKVAMPTQKGTSGLLTLASNKDLKITSSEILLIQEGLKKWEIERKKVGFTILPSGLGLKIIKEGTGEVPKKESYVNVHYTGFLSDGKVFDSSLERGAPFGFRVGMGQVIKGWDEGIGMLKVGTKAVLRIPPELGYGNRDLGVIPPNSLLYFEVEILDAQ